MNSYSNPGIDEPTGRTQGNATRAGDGQGEGAVIPSPAPTKAPDFANATRAGEGQGEGEARHRLAQNAPREASATRCASADDMRTGIEIG